MRIQIYECPKSSNTKNCMLHKSTDTLNSLDYITSNSCLLPNQSSRNTVKRIQKRQKIDLDFNPLTNQNTLSIVNSTNPFIL